MESHRIPPISSLAQLMMEVESPLKKHVEPNTLDLLLPEDVSGVMKSKVNLAHGFSELHQNPSTEEHLDAMKVAEANHEHEDFSELAVERKVTTECPTLGE
jgi:hypothetical protein